MNQALFHWLQWRPYTFSSLPYPIQLISKPKPLPSISSTLNDSLQQNQQEEDQLPARERRKLRNERREMKAYDWKDHVETILIKKPTKRYAKWTDELNLDSLAHDGPQWWVARVARVKSHETAERLARSLANNFPDITFKVYLPAVQEKRKLKNGTYSVKPKPLFPGCLFLRCVLNKELHDFIREYDGIGGFIGSKVGNAKRQINKPRPVSEEDMEAIFRQAKEEQEKADQAFEEQEKANQAQVLDSQAVDLETLVDIKPKRRTKKASEPASKGRSNKLPKAGTTVRVVSGSFAEYTGILKKLDRKNGTVTVGFTLFGKETIADLNIDDIVEHTE